MFSKWDDIYNQKQIYQALDALIYDLTFTSNFHVEELLRASPTVLQFLFCKTRSLPSLKSIGQVTKLSVSNGFGKIELAK